MEAQQLQLNLVTYAAAPRQTLEQMLQLYVAKLYGASWKQITSKKRQPNLVKARFLYCYFAYFEIQRTFVQIAVQIGNRHHTTVINGVQQTVEHLNSKDPAFNEFKQKFHLIQLFITTQTPQNDYHYRDVFHRTTIVRYTKTPTIQEHR